MRTYYKYDTNGYYAGESAIPVTRATLDSLPDEPLEEGMKWRYIGKWVQSLPWVAPIDTLEKLKTEAITKLHAEQDALFTEYMAQYPELEKSSFTLKQAEAEAYNLDPNVPTPTLERLKGIIGVPVLVEAILTKIEYLANIENGTVEKRDAIKACTTIEELEAIVI